MNLLIVESPNKASTIQEYLSQEKGNWKVIATNGHFKNLKTEDIAVDIKNDSYVGNFVIEKKDVYKNLKDAILKSTHVFIATDDDREGEAIAHDVIDSFKLSEDKYSRVIFTEISQKKIIELLLQGAGKEELNKNLVDARFSRRIIDRLIGYKLSPLLKYVFKENKDAKIKGIGRVSFAALSILTEREKEIAKFDPYVYRKINATYRIGDKELYCVSEKKYVEGEDDDNFYRDINILNKEEHIVTVYDVEPEDTPPPKPILYSSLMSNIFHLYRFTGEETAKIAQKLFEGVKINGKKMGLITYMRSDSYRISEESAQQASELIPYIVMNKDDGPLGLDYLALARREHKNKSGAQDAHEAVRPIHITNEYAPHNLRKYLSPEEFKVYDYIYKITVSSLMANSSYIKTKATITCGEIVLKSETKEQIFDGWEVVGKHYVPFFRKFEKLEDNPPALYINDILKPKEVNHWSRNAKSPDRYSEGGFIDTLASKGIGRPSTLPGIIPELKRKEYTKSTKGMLFPSITATSIVDWAKEAAPWIVDTNHAREFEDSLSKIEAGETQRDSLIHEYDLLLKELYLSLDYKDIEEYKKEPPSKKQLETILKLKDKGIDVPELSIGSKIEAGKFLSKYFDSQKVCKCRFCENGEISDQDSRYTCSNKVCDFILWKNKVTQFINNFKIEISPDELSLYVLKKQKHLVENLTGKSAIFDANVSIEKSEQFGYGLTFKVYNKRNDTK